MTVKAMYPRDAGFVTLEEIRATAIGNLPRDVADYLEAGAGAERTLRANREAFGRWVMTVDCTFDASAVLASGPPVGSKIVSEGAEELLGTEFFVSK